MPACITLPVKTFLFLSLLCASLSQAAPPPPNNNILRISSNHIVTQMEAQLTKQPDLSKTLILLDLDETLIKQKPGEFLGTSDMFYFLKAHIAKEKGITVQQASDYIDPVLTELYKHINLVLTDEALSSWIEHLKNHGATVLGFTARGPNVADVTLGQLKKVNIRFSPINTTKNVKFFIKEGLYTIGQSQTKGQALEHLLASSCCTIHNQIVFLDDKIKHLNHAADIMRKFSTIEFLPVLITTNQKTAFNPEEAMKQLCHFFNTHTQDAGLQALIKQGNPWALEITKACRKPVASIL